MDDSLKHLDRIVEILRAKKKYIFIEKKTKCHCHDDLPTLYNK